jgi:hypothetical protein
MSPHNHLLPRTLAAHARVSRSTHRVRLEPSGLRRQTPAMLTNGAPATGASAVTVATQASVQLWIRATHHWARCPKSRAEAIGPPACGRAPARWQPGLSGGAFNTADRRWPVPYPHGPNPTRAEHAETASTVGGGASGAASCGAIRIGETFPSSNLVPSALTNIPATESNVYYSQHRICGVLSVPAPNRATRSGRAASLMPPRRLLRRRGCRVPRIARIVADRRPVTIRPLTGRPVL